MPRPKTLPDEDVLEAALRLVHARGPDALTFASLAGACGLSASTLVQRFGGKSELKRATLLHAWDRLDARTAARAETVPRTPDGAIALLTGLSRAYGDIAAYAEGLLVLREDLRDPALRARGAAWKRTLTQVLDGCFEASAEAPDDMGQLMAAQWQGALLWWAFEPRGAVEDHVADWLRRFVAAVVGGSGSRPGTDRSGQG